MRICLNHLDTRRIRIRVTLNSLPISGSTNSNAFKTRNTNTENEINLTKNQHIIHAQD
jgi:hypothetical protein